MKVSRRRGSDVDAIHIVALLDCSIMIIASRGNTGMRLGSLKVIANTVTGITWCNMDSGMVWP